MDDQVLNSFFSILRFLQLYRSDPKIKPTQQYSFSNMKARSTISVILRNRESTFFQANRKNTGCAFFFAGDWIRNGLTLTFYEFRKRETPKLVFCPTYKERPNMMISKPFAFFLWIPRGICAHYWNRCFLFFQMCKIVSHQMYDISILTDTSYCTQIIICL